MCSNMAFGSSSRAIHLLWSRSSICGLDWKGTSIVLSNASRTDPSDGMRPVEGAVRTATYRFASVARSRSRPGHGR